MPDPMTVDREAAASLEAKGSRFLAHLIPAARFEARLEALRAEHRKASHVVTATRRIGADGSVAERSRDDGEPGGTAGMPVLRVMIGAGLVEAGIVVIRYFGGTKLGTGGLMRAYGGAAARAVEAAALRPWRRMETGRLTCGFAEVSALERAVEALGLTVEARDYREDGVALTVHGPTDALRHESLSPWRA